MNEKCILNFEEARKYLGYSKSHMYKLTSAGIIPFSKLLGGKLYFDREALEKWMLGSPNATQQELQISAATYVSTSGR